MSWSDFHRLRKYRRKKLNGGWNDRYGALYWRYHHKVHGPQGHLWGKPEPSRPPRR